MSIFKLSPAFKDYIWGGSRLKTDFFKNTDITPLAESWELSAHVDGESKICGGKFDNMGFSQYIKENPQALGTNCRKFENFPILIKLIDAYDNLSVQVHPDNEYAMRVEGEYGKTEMWYIVDCDENAELIYGFKREISKEEFAERIQNNTLLDVVNKVKVKKGDVFFIEAGTLHAIGKGILIAEIQQNSNTTYRVYDYGRVGADGKPRALHIDKALDVTNLQCAPLTQSGDVHCENGALVRKLARCDYFDVSELKIDERAELFADKSTFNSLLFISGEGIIESGGQKTAFKKGDSIFVSAGTEYQIIGKCVCILTKI